MSGNIDQTFVAMLIPHHQDAISMAQAELRYGKEPVPRRLASVVISVQRKEIAQMQHWQKAHPAR